MSMRLLGSLTSPYVRKVRAVLAEKKLDYQFVPENVWAEDSRIMDSNPLGKVPCLLIEGQDPVFDSRVIVEYLDALSPVGRLIPSAGRQRVEVKTWEALADGMLDAAVAARLEQHWPERAEGQRSPAWIARQMHKIDAGLAHMSRDLGDKPWCSAGVQLSLADIAVGCTLAYLDLRFPALDWRSRHANLARLLDERLMSRSSFLDTVPPA